MHKFTKELKKDLTIVFNSFSYAEYTKMFLPVANSVEEFSEFLSESGGEIYSNVLKLYSPLQEVFRDHGFPNITFGMRYIRKCIRFHINIDSIQYSITYNIEDGIVDIEFDADLKN